MAGLVFLLVSWVLAGACRRHGVGGSQIVQFIIIFAVDAELMHFHFLQLRKIFLNCLCTLPYGQSMTKDKGTWKKTRKIIAKEQGNELF